MADAGAIMANVSDLTGPDQYCTEQKVWGQRTFMFYIAGTWEGTITLQGCRLGETVWHDADTFTENGLYVADSCGSWLWRAGFKPGEYTSGTASCEVVV